METKNYVILTFGDKIKLKEIHLDCFGIKQIQFEKMQIPGAPEGWEALLASAELPEEAAQYLREHDFICSEITDEP